MPGEIGRRDYSLVGAESRRAVENAGTAPGAAWYASPIPRKEMKELMPPDRRAGDPRHADLVRGARDHRRARRVLLGQLVGRAVLRGLWRAVRLGLGQPLARMRPRHRLQDPLDERRRLPHRPLHDPARADGLALEPAHGTTPTPIIVGRDPEIAAPRPPSILKIVLNIFMLKSSEVAIRKLFVHAGGRLTAEEETFIPEMERWKVFLVARIYLGDLRRGDRRLPGAGQHPAGHVCRAADPLWRRHGPVLRPDPACRPGRGRAGPPAEQPHRLHEPGVPVPRTGT